MQAGGTICPLSLAQSLAQSNRYSYVEAKQEKQGEEENHFNPDPEEEIIVLADLSKKA